MHVGFSGFLKQVGTFINPLSSRLSQKFGIDALSISQFKSPIMSKFLYLAESESIVN